MEDASDQMLVTVPELTTLEPSAKPPCVTLFANTAPSVLPLTLVTVPLLDPAGVDVDVKLPTAVATLAKTEVNVQPLGSAIVPIPDIRDLLVKLMKMSAKDSNHLVIKDSNV